MNKRISAVICTHNRSQWLEGAIRSLVTQEAPPEGPSDFYEIIVVDNGSTDDTRQTVRSLSGLADIRYIHEPRLGLSHARNTGWRRALTPYVAFLDDDARASPGWLKAILNVFENVRPQPGCTGGRVLPIWEAERPPWLSDRLLTGLTVIDWSETPHAIENLGSEWLAGANMALPVAVLDAVGGFTPALDRSGKNMLSSGDVYLQKQVMRSGLSCYYDPGIVVEHLVPASRLTRSWFIRRYFWQGVSDAVMHLLDASPSSGNRFAEAGRSALRLLRRPGEAVLPLSRSDDPDRFTLKCFTMIRWGYVAGLLLLARKNPGRPSTR